MILAIIAVIVVVCCVAWLIHRNARIVEDFSYLSVTMNVDTAKRPNMCVVDTSIVHDQWIIDAFQMHRTPTPLKDAYVYADTATASHNPKLKGMYLASVLDHHRAAVLFTKEVSEMTLPLAAFVADTPLVTVWVRTDVEKTLAQTIFASTVPGTKTAIEYTSNPLSRPGVYCMLVDMADPVLGYARAAPCAILTYDDMNMDHSRHFLPYHDTRQLNVASVLDRPSREGERTRCMAFPYCVWSPHDFVAEPPYVTITDETLRTAGFYANFLNVGRYVMKRAASAHKSHAAHRLPVAARHSLVEEDLETGRRVIKGPTPLPKGNTWVKVAGEDHVYENSHVARFSDRIETVAVNKDHVVVKIPHIPPDHTHVYLQDLGHTAHIVRNVDGVATVVVWLIDPEARDRVTNNAKYTCVTNAKLEFDFQCEAEEGGVWDRPCESDFECPFNSLDSRRGGCDSVGYCEMPLGVRRTGFRKYDANSRPFCRGCPDPLSDPHCCGADASRYAFAMGELGERISPT